MNVSPTSDQTIPDGTENWREAAKQQGVGSLLLERTLGTMGLWRGRMLTERIAKKAQDGTIGRPTIEPQDKALEDMEVRVGNEVHYHYQGAGTSPPSRSGVGTPAIAALAASMLLGPAAGVGLYAMLNAPQPTPPPAAVDTDTRYGLEVSSSPASPAATDKGQP